MLTFIHLSDIHFQKIGSAAQFDLDEQLREKLLADLESRPSGAHPYDGILVSGDVAFGGQAVEYDRAKEWLKSICDRTGTDPTAIFVVPGNHDVDRSFVGRDGAIWNNHLRLREEQEAIKRTPLFEAQLLDKSCDALRPLHAFNDFAQCYDCKTECQKLAWSHEFPKALDDGTRVLLHGLNSAAISDSNDHQANLLLGEFQLQHFRNWDGVVQVVLCHHPPHWLIDGVALQGALRSYAHIALFGHEHLSRIQVVDGVPHLFSGAVHPNRKESNWQPTYHVLEIRVDTISEKRFLVGRVFTRQWLATEQRFIPLAAPDGKHFTEFTRELPAWSAPANSTFTQGGQCVSSDVVVPASTNSDTGGASATSLRDLRVHFFCLSTALRYVVAEEANLWPREGDDKLDGQSLWASVFRRAEAEGHLHDLWEAVAKRDTRLRSKQNPF